MDTAISTHKMSLGDGIPCRAQTQQSALELAPHADTRNSLGACAESTKCKGEGFDVGLG
jgi:hypothetical protein